MHRPLALMLAVLLAGGPAAGLQVAAWIGMFSARVATARTLGEALVSTVDGTRPCAVCRVADALRRDSPAPDAPAKTVKKPELAEPPMIARLPSAVPGAVITAPRVLHLAGCGRSAPEPPPPRV